MTETWTRVRHWQQKRWSKANCVSCLRTPKWHAILYRISNELEDEKDIEHKQSIIEYLNGLLNTWIRSVFKDIVYAETVCNVGI